MDSFAVRALGYEAGDSSAGEADGVGAGGVEVEVFGDWVKEGWGWAVDSGVERARRRGASGAGEVAEETVGGGGIGWGGGDAEVFVGGRGFGIGVGVRGHCDSLGVKGF